MIRVLTDSKKKGITEIFGLHSPERKFTPSQNSALPKLTFSRDFVGDRISNSNYSGVRGPLSSLFSTNQTVDGEKSGPMGSKGFTSKRDLLVEVKSTGLNPHNYLIWVRSEKLKITIRISRHCSAIEKLSARDACKRYLQEGEEKEAGN